MKKMLIISSALVLLTAGTLSAQVKSYKASTVGGANSIAYSLPQTVVKVRLVMDKEMVRPGPYARFAQKYLGVMAPLASKNIYTLVDAQISYGEEADPSQVYVMDNPDKSPLQLYTATPEGFVAAPMDGSGVPVHLYAATSVPAVSGGIQSVSNVLSDTSFVKVPVDRREVMERTPEDMANTAANAIYTLRKRRLELVTGEAGENVFSEGLRTALDEINRLEHEYLALFLGKQSHQQVVREFDVVPEAGKNNIMVCRFSDTEGALGVSDLSGRPIVLEMTPEKKAQQSPIVNRTTKDSRGTVHYRIADMVNTALVDGKREIARARIPIYQYGVVVEIPVTSLK